MYAQRVSRIKNLQALMAKYKEEVETQEAKAREEERQRAWQALRAQMQERIIQERIEVSYHSNKGYVFLESLSASNE